MRITFIYILSILFYSLSVKAQISNGTVSSLVAAENYFAGIAKEKGIKKAFLMVSDENTLLFKPDPVKAEKFLDKNPADEGYLNWYPALAKISKSGDWGFTTGPYTYRADPESENTSYGDYLSVWKMNSKGVWKLALDIGISHKKPSTEPQLAFMDPKSSRFFNQKSEKRLKQREEIILTNDQLFSATLKKYGNLAYNVFVGEEAHFLFPGYEPILGKSNINDFLRNNQIEIETEPTKADRALGSDLAYTYGKATIVKDAVTKSYNYVRIWEVQDGHKWNVLVELFSPAGEN
ncbi:MAG: nuclear transport factor 2 family protein [Daejeonella sp.]